ncbi:NADH-quinone oxidoreductase subunit C, partial [Streptomyces zaomyceticus]|uniref:NADH-quinone oxidoreductase subunit C n=1 Tax=Streptomyces zaomyceticus TaxID=68286 RepID=UPI0036D0CEAF
MTTYDSLPGAVTEIFGEEATAEQAYDLLTVDVPPGSWITALETARDTLGCTYFDWLSAVDEPGTGFRVCAHVVALTEGRPRRLLVRTTVPHAEPVLPTALGVYAGAGWHERETHEMFGVVFTGHPNLVPLLLPENFEGHPLRKDFVLAARVAKAWPGAKEPGESHDGGGPKRRQMLPPGVPDPNEWGPLKGQLPPAPTRPARAAAGDRPVRRARSVTEGSATGPETPTRRTRTATEGTPPEPGAETPKPAGTTSPAPRRSRSAADGSASQASPEPGGETAEAPASAARPPRRSRSAADGSASQTTSAPGTETAKPAEPSAPVPRRSRSAADGSVSQVSPEPGAEPEAAESAEPSAPVTRRTRSAADGSVSQASPETGGEAAEAPGSVARPPRRTRSAADGSVSQASPESGAAPEADAAGQEPGGSATTPPTAGRPPRRNRSAADGSASQATPEGHAQRAAARPPRTRSSDAPWHHARPAFDEERSAPAKPDTPAEPDSSGTAPAEPPAAEPGASAPATAAEPDAAAEAKPVDPQPAQPGTGPKAP